MPKSSAFMSCVSTAAAARPMAMPAPVRAGAERGNIHRSMISAHPASDLPIDFDITRGVTFAVRSTRAGTPEFIGEVQRAVWSVNGSLLVADVGRWRTSPTKSCREPISRW
jgi:hypothetical protein